MAQDTAPQTEQVQLPQGYDTVEELHESVHATITLILADVDYGFYTAEEALDKIVVARKEADDYLAAKFKANQL